MTWRGRHDSPSHARQRADHGVSRGVAPQVDIGKGSLKAVYDNLVLSTVTRRFQHGLSPQREHLRAVKWGGLREQTALAARSIFEVLSWVVSGTKQLKLRCKESSLLTRKAPPRQSR